MKFYRLCVEILFTYVFSGVVGSIGFIVLAIFNIATSGWNINVVTAVLFYALCYFVIALAPLMMQSRMYMSSKKLTTPMAVESTALPIIGLVLVVLSDPLVKNITNTKGNDQNWQYMAMRVASVVLSLGLACILNAYLLKRRKSTKLALKSKLPYAIGTVSLVLIVLGYSASVIYFWYVETHPRYVNDVAAYNAQFKESYDARRYAFYEEDIAWYTIDRSTIDYAEYEGSNDQRSSWLSLDLLNEDGKFSLSQLRRGAINSPKPINCTAYGISCFSLNTSKGVAECYSNTSFVNCRITIDNTQIELSSYGIFEANILTKTIDSLTVADKQVLLTYIKF